MNMHWLDWSIVLTMLAVITYAGLATRKHTKSVADFLVAGRCAGKYIMAVGDGIAGLCAISVIAFFEQYYKAGFSAIWWDTARVSVLIIVAVTGWIQYRYRETRVMTMAQFMEVRYSRSFRVFSGFLCFFSGTLNFGIFPAVGGRFFQYYCGLPAWPVSIGFAQIDLTFALIMAFLLAISLAFTFMGGQIAVMVTDFLQGMFVNISFCILAAYFLFFRFSWDQLLTGFAAAPADASLINPANSGGTDNFDPTYFLVAAFGMFLNFMAWQGNQGYSGCAKTPHAARMGRVIGNIRPIIQTLAMAIMALGAYAYLHNPDFSEGANRIQDVLNSIDNPKIQTQQLVPIALTQILPRGLLGLFAAVMLAAFISTHDTYLHSWGSIFIQDVWMPIRQVIRGDNKPMAPKTHLFLLKCSIFGVAVFIFIFSLFFYQKQDVLMFFALTGTFYLGWAGWTICGGLYWKYGNSAGAWTAAIVGIVLSVGGWLLTYQWTHCQGFAEWLSPSLWTSVVDAYPKLGGGKCPYSAQDMYFWSMMITGVVYVGSSLLGGRKAFNMDRMLHRGPYAVEEVRREDEPARGLKVFKWSSQFTLDDRILYILSLAFIFVTTGVFLVVTILFVTFPTMFTDGFWSEFWWVYCIVMLFLSAILAIWLAVGGFIDLKALFVTLGQTRRDEMDDGTVVGHQSLADLPADKAEPPAAD